MDHQEKEENTMAELETDELKLSDSLASQSVHQQVQNSISPILGNIDSIKQIQESSKRIVSAIQPMLQMQVNMSAVLDKFRQSLIVSTPVLNQMQELADTLKRAFSYSAHIDFSEFSEAARRMTAGIAEAVQKIKIPSISEERKQELLEIHRMWGSYGWTINPCVAVNTLFDCAPADKKSADSIALKQCSGQKMERIFEVIEKNKRVKKTDFCEAIFDYKHKQYKSSALILFSLIDALLIRLQKKSALDGKRRKVGLNAVNEAKKRTENDLNTELLFTAMFCTNLFACLEKVFEGGKDFKKQPTVINRNFLDHGMLTRKVTRKDCIQLFLLYYNVLELLDMIY